MKKQIELPPGDTQLEQIILGTILIDSDVIHEYVQDLNPNLFFNKECKSVCKVILELYKLSEPIDLVTIVHKAKSMNLQNDVKPIFVSELTNRVASGLHFEHHFRILQQYALRRRIMEISSNVLKSSFDDTQDVFDLFSSASKDFDDAMKSIVNVQIQNVGEIHNDIINKSIDILNSGIKSGVESGLTMVDNLTNGWQNSDLIILAGRPSMGKTATAISMSMHPALELNIPIGIFSLEMSSSQLVSRMQSMMTEINVGRIVKKQLTIEEINDIRFKGKTLEKAPIYIDDTPSLSVMEFKSKARKMVREFGVRFIVVDYLQLMRSGVKTQSREQEIAEISRSLKAIAKELDIPVMALSQLSRAVETRGGDKKPQLSDLRESGQIEQDADMVMFCYRPEYYNIERYQLENEEFDTHGLFMLLISKHRNGELGEIPLTFIHEQTKITNHSFSSTNFEHPHNNSTFVQRDEASTMSRWESTKEHDDTPF